MMTVKIRPRSGVRLPQRRSNGSWEKGRSGNPAGRPKGPNRVTREHKAWLRALFESDDYRTMFERKLRQGQLPPNIWQDALNRAYGKPATSVESGPTLLDLLLAQGQPSTDRLLAQRGPATQPSLED